MSWRNALKPFRLKLHFSNKYCYAQILRTSDGHIVAAASTLEKSVSEVASSASDCRGASVVGTVLANRAKAADISAVHWDRKRGQKYHGKIAAVIDSMRSAGVGLN